jgi:nucleotide-binding universal stress UspA family protein
VLAEHLRYRGVTCEFATVKRGASDVGECLQQAALAADAGLLIMGAYGHNRLREWVLGGATRSLIAHRQLTVLMSH